MAPPEDIQHAFDDEPGIARRKSGSGFAYYDARGNRITDAAIRQRIRELVIPPAWTDVWICPDLNGHIQATGRDARGRKQYIYHADWRSWREQTKFLHILEFAAALPKLRDQVARDLADRKLSRRLVLATAVRVLDRTLMRVGNDEYARENDSYGLTTLNWEHVERAGSRVRFSFRGKHGKPFAADLDDRRVAAILRRLEGLPGQHLFQFVDDDENLHRIYSDDVNAYIREATGGDFSAKDFRTWAATVLAAVGLLKCEAAQSERSSKHNIAAAIRRVAGRLGNTPAVCRSSYVHPYVIESYMDGTLGRLARAVEGALAESEEDEAAAHENLLVYEIEVLRFLRRRTRKSGEPSAVSALPLTEAA